MYLVTRMRTAEPGRLREAIEWCLDARDYVNANTALDVSMHASVFGLPSGTITAAGFVEGRGQWLAETDKILADSVYQEKLQRAAELLGPARDSFRQVLHLSGLSIGDPRPAITQNWSADIARFQFDAAMAWAIEVSDYVVGLTGVPIALLAEGYGNFGTLVWIAALDSAEKADQMNEAMLADAGWRKMVAQAADLFIDGQTKVWLNRTLP
jgi:hypothetical protein